MNDQTPCNDLNMTKHLQSTIFYNLFLHNGPGSYARNRLHSPLHQSSSELTAKSHYCSTSQFYSIPSWVKHITPLTRASRCEAIGILDHTYTILDCSHKSYSISLRTKGSANLYIIQFRSDVSIESSQNL